jgi:hypothetical protein
MHRLMHLTACCLALLVVHCGGDDGAQPTTDERLPAPTKDDVAVHVEGVDPATGTTKMDFVGTAATGSDDGVKCEYWNSRGAIPPFFVLSAKKGNSTVLLKWWDFSLDAGESRAETFTSRKSSMQIGVQLLQAPYFHYTDPFSPAGGSCTTTLTKFTDTAMAGSLSCEPLPGDGADSKLSLNTTFRCPLVYHPAS